jgi:hypothetical protein
MRSKNRRRSTDQLLLFLPSAPVQWSAVPAAVRSRTVALLAHLLRQHARARRATEVRDE